MKTSDSVDSSKSTRLSVKNRLKDFWGRKESKIVVVGLGLVLLVFGLGYFVRHSFFVTQNKSNSNLIESTLGSIQINAKEFEYGTPLTLRCTIPVKLDK